MPTSLTRSNNLTTINDQERDFQRIIDLVINTVGPRSRRDYTRALNDFLAWYLTTQQSRLNKATVYAHIEALKAQGVPSSSINQRLAAIRKLALEAADNNLIDESTAQAIRRVANIKIQGRKLGNWLTAQQAAIMIDSPDASLRGLRDRAILAVMIGCGLRREETCALTVEHLQQRDGRWVILDLVGKHNRTRTIPMAAWVKAIIDNWLTSSRITTGSIFRRIRKNNDLQPKALSPQAIWFVVQEYAPVSRLSPHDLRRTYAKLAAKGGSPLVQIQKSMGHASVQTTERYVGDDQDLQNSPSDNIHLDLNR